MSLALAESLYKLENTPNAVPVRISDIVAGVGWSNIGNLTNVNKVLYFTATNNNGFGDRIYKVNAARTSVAATGGNIIHADNLVAKGSTLYFTQYSTANDPMLCKMVNGAVSTIKIFMVGGEPQYLTVVGNHLYFSAANATRGRELWKTNDNATDASPISDLIQDSGSSFPKDLTNFNGVLHFTALTTEQNGTRQIFKTNANLSDVESIGGPVVGPSDLEATGNNLFFFQTVPDQSSAKLCILVNGIATPIKSFGPVHSEPLLSKLGMTAAGNNVYFGAYTAENGIELWKSNGTEDGTVRIGDIRTGPIGCNLLEMRLAGSDLYLSAHNLPFGQEPWKVANANALGEPGGEERDEIAAISSAVNITISPNPASDYVQVILPENNISGSISIVSVSGQTIRSVQVSEGETSVRLNLQDLPKGLYLVRWAQVDGQVLTQKLVVQ